MKLNHIAFVHDRIYHLGGAEKVFLDLIEQRLKETEQQGVPEKGNPGKGRKILNNSGTTVSPGEGKSLKREKNAKIFTLFSDRRSIIVADKDIEIVTALPRWMFGIFQYFEKHRVIGLSQLFDYRNLMFFYPLLVWILRHKVRLFDPDELIVSSFAAVKNIVPMRGGRDPEKSEKSQKNRTGNSKTSKSWQVLGTLQTTLYLHSPMQYIWDYYEDNVRKLRSPIRQLYQLITPVLRHWDKTPREYDVIYYNSNYTRQGAQRLYGWGHGEVMYPPLEPQYMQAEIVQQSHSNSDQIGVSQDESDYYIFIGRLVRFAKELDLIIRVFNHTGYVLKIVGSGPDEAYLRSIAGPNITFVGHVSDVNEKISLVGQSRGLINLTRESFGMVTAEALCLGVPVFGYAEGGSVELVDEQSGILISDKTPDSVIKQFELFKSKEWDREFIYRRANSMFG